MWGSKIKVEVREGKIDPSDESDLSHYLDRKLSDDWELQHVIPQQEDGTTDRNVFIFKKVKK